MLMTRWPQNRTPRPTEPGARSGSSRREQGSLLLDVLIGMVIFGLLATIAVSGFGQYRQRAFEQAAMADANSLAVSLEAGFTDQDAYPAVLDAAAIDTMRFTLSKGNRIGAYDKNRAAFAVCVEHTAGGTADAYAVYDSVEGGLIDHGRGKGCDPIDLPDEIRDPQVPVDSPEPPEPEPDPEPTTISDAFNGSGTLGVTEVGNKVWLEINGTWSRNGSGLATTTTPATQNPMAVVDVGTSDVDISTTLPTGSGETIYFRVKDGNNWLRARYKRDRSTSTYYLTEYYHPNWFTEYEYRHTNPATANAWVQSGTSSWCAAAAQSDSGESGNSYGFTTAKSQISSTKNNCGGTGSGLPYTVTWTTWTRTINAPTYSYYWSVSGADERTGNTRQKDVGGTWDYNYCAGCTTRQAGPFSTTSTDYYLVVEKAVAGTVTTLKNYSIGSSTSMRVVAQGSAITVYRNSTTQVGTFTDATLSTATMHGVGLSGDTYNGGTSLTDFSLKKL